MLKNPPLFKTQHVSHSPRSWAHLHFFMPWPLYCSLCFFFFLSFFLFICLFCWNYSLPFRRIESGCWALQRTHVESPWSGLVVLWCCWRKHQWTLWLCSLVRTSLTMGFNEQIIIENKHLGLLAYNCQFYCNLQPKCKLFFFINIFGSAVTPCCPMIKMCSHIYLGSLAKCFSWVAKSNCSALLIPKVAALTLTYSLEAIKCRWQWMLHMWHCSKCRDGHRPH